MEPKGKLGQALAEADELYEAERAGIELPPIDESTVAMPNLAKSKIVHVRVSDRTYAALTARAEAANVRVSDVVRSAVGGYLREDQSEAEELIAALHDRGLRLVSAEVPAT